MARLQGDARPHRQGARLATDGPRRVRQRGRARLVFCRFVGVGRALVCVVCVVALCFPVSAEVFGGAIAAREANAEYRALWTEGGADGAGDDGVRNSRQSVFALRASPDTTLCPSGFT